MKFIHRLSLFMIVVLAALPLVILAQDNGTPSSPDDDLLVPPVPTVVPKATTDYDSLELTIVPTVDVHLATPATEELIEYPTDDGIHLATPATEELYEYPVDPCKLDPSHDPGIALEQILCPPTRTPTPTYVPITVTPGANIVNGLWVLDPSGSTFVSNGQCQLEGGDNDGPSGIGEELEDLPRVPVCMTSDTQWLTVDSGGAFPLVVANFYSQQEMTRQLLTTNGVTSGTINVNITRQYHVISPSEIEYSYITNEQGGCTRNSTVRYRLMEVNELVCKGVVMTPNYTAVPTQMPTAKPGETQIPMPTVEPPIQIGEYTIQLPPVDATCSADKMPPSDKFNLSYDNNQNMFINFGGGSYTLYWDGGDYFNYQAGNQFNLSMVTYSGGASFAWSQAGCFISSELMMEGAPTATPVPVEPTSEAYTGEAVAVGSHFTTTFDAQEALCATENKSLLPDLNSGILNAKDDKSFVFSVGGQNYTLTNQDGYYVYTQVGDDGSMLVVAMNGFYEGSGSGSFSVYGADGKMCTAILTFTPVG